MHAQTNVAKTDVAEPKAATKATTRVVLPFEVASRCSNCFRVTFYNAKEMGLMDRGALRD